MSHSLNGRLLVTVLPASVAFEGRPELSSGTAVSVFFEDGNISNVRAPGLLRKPPQRARLLASQSDASSQSGARFTHGESHTTRAGLRSITTARLRG